MIHHTWEVLFSIFRYWIAALADNDPMDRGSYCNYNVVGLIPIGHCYSMAGTFLLLLPWRKDTTVTLPPVIWVSGILKERSLQQCNRINVDLPPLSARGYLHMWAMGQLPHVALHQQCPAHASSLLFLANLWLWKRCLLGFLWVPWIAWDLGKLSTCYKYSWPSTVWAIVTMVATAASTCWKADYFPHPALSYPGFYPNSGSVYPDSSHVHFHRFHACAFQLTQK